MSIPPQALLPELQATLAREIPLCAQMGIEVVSCDETGLTMVAPLAPNRNHRGTAFAGSINALCTSAGWGSVFLLVRQHQLPGDIVIRRSSIKYLKPVATPVIRARAFPIDPAAAEYFLEMLREKGQAKLDLHVEIAAEGETLVTFDGSYVVVESRK